MRHPLLRRDFLKDLCSSILLGVAFVGRSASAVEACADLAKLDSGAAGLRASLNYAETSPDSAKTCAACAFFAAGTGGCGTCQILSGPANSKGHCDSWGPRA